MVNGNEGHHQPPAAANGGIVEPAFLSLPFCSAAFVPPSSIANSGNSMPKGSSLPLPVYAPTSAYAGMSCFPSVSSFNYLASPACAYPSMGSGSSQSHASTSSIAAALMSACMNGGGGGSGMANIST